MGILQLLVQYFDIFTSTFLRLFLYSKSQVQNPDSPNKTEPLDVEELASSRSGLAPNSESQDRREVHGADVCRESDPWHLECPQLGIMVPPSQFGTEGGAVNKNDLSGHKWIS